MKRKEFIKIIHRAMDQIQNDNETFCCIAIDPYIDRRATNIAYDFWENVFRRRYSSTQSLESEHKIVYGYSTTKSLSKTMRLNALAMYLAQSLAFKTYKRF